jgi:hypothetical protein
MMAMPLRFIGHHTIPVGYSKTSDFKAEVSFLLKGIRLPRRVSALFTNTRARDQI